MRHLGTVVWLTVLGVAGLSILTGYLSGKSLQNSHVIPVALAVQEDVAPPPIQRALYGARGLDVPLEPVQPPTDDVVVARPAGWAPSRKPSQRETVQLAIVICGIGEDRTLDKRFMEIGFPLSFAVAAVDNPPSERLRDDPRELVVDVDPSVAPERVSTALVQLGAGGVLTPSAGDSIEPEPLVRRLAATETFVIDGMADGTPAVYEAARERHLAAATRDIVIDAHEETSYATYMLRQAGKLARRTGVAIAIGHAYPETYEALRRALPQLTAEGVEIVPVGELAR